MELPENDDGRKGGEEGSEPEPWRGAVSGSLGQIKPPICKCT